MSLGSATKIPEKVVSVCMITYKHEQYIAQAIEGILLQKTSFRVQLVIGEDSSPDGTRKICEAYAARYPHIIKLLPSDARYGMIGNFLRTARACEGEYIATCEGDDYWTDPEKLQLQADFLDSNKGVSLCNHALDVIDQDGTFLKTIGEVESDISFTFKTSLIKRIGGSASMMFRKSALNIDHLAMVLGDKAYQVDWCLELFLLDNGTGHYMPRAMAVYRRHPGGVTFISAHNIPINIINNRIFVIERLIKYIAPKNRASLKSFLGILHLKAAQIDKTSRKQNLLKGTQYLVRYPYFLLNISKVADRFNPFR